MKRILISAGAVTAAVMAGCGKQPVKPIDQASSGAAGMMLKATAEASASNLSGNANALAGAPCYTVSGDTSDPDHDGIPTDATITFVNCSSTSTSGTAVFNGYVHAKDLNNSGPTFDFENDAQLSLVLTASNGDNASIDRAGVAIASSGGGAKYELKDAQKTQAGLSVAGVSHQGEEDYALDEAFTPSPSWQMGQPADGGFSITGAYQVKVDNAEAASALNTPAPGLTLSASCASHIVAGEVDAGFQATDGNGNSVTRVLKVVWSGCDQAQVSIVDSATGSTS